MSRMDALNIVIIGVGGQGTLLASKIIGAFAQRLGYDVKVSEVHGMSQRGGSVITYVRIGSSVHAPLVEQKGADYILAFEKLEALRALPYLKQDGLLIMSTQQILPLPVIIGASEYPANIIETIRESGVQVVDVDALQLAEKAGNQRTVNSVLIGILASHLPFDKADWLESIQCVVPERHLQVNLDAFNLGYQQL